LQTNVPSTSIQRQISNVENQNNNEKEDQTFPPPPLFINDIEQQEQQQLNIKATGSGLTDGFVEENCPLIELNPKPIFVKFKTIF